MSGAGAFYAIEEFTVDIPPFPAIPVGGIIALLALAVLVGFGWLPL
jgi:hypothetical protein